MRTATGNFGQLGFKISKVRRWSRALTISKMNADPQGGGGGGREFPHRLEKGTSAREDVGPRRGVDTRQCANKDVGSRRAVDWGSYIDWQRKECQ
ncbi:hypothetical protein SDJN02_11655, partial [Cucurbita argyrosperma subsp. argyrosperma]